MLRSSGSNLSIWSWWRLAWLKKNLPKKREIENVQTIKTCFYGVSSAHRRDRDPLSASRYRGRPVGLSRKSEWKLDPGEKGYPGSELIGQPFDDPKYFWGRLSATPDFPYNSASSSGSNLGPSNPALVEAVKARVEALQKADPGNTSSIPIDLVTSSGSGLDPHISPAAALYQASRVARARGLPEDQMRHLVERVHRAPPVGLLGEPRVNVLKLNLFLDNLGTPNNNQKK